MKIVQIKEEYIKLDSFLKFSGAVLSGGKAKLIIQSGLVKVNGEEATQRGKKIRNGDKVEFNGEIYVCKAPEI